MIGYKVPERVRMIQFHQSYAYEDFIQGYRPRDDGGFELRDGVFHTFCREAAANPGDRYVFIIDEVNRGNLSKIFGELMMLIEADKRGAEYAVPLTYSPSAEPFHVPPNVYLIGMMNTADRSLAMVDYALRRRFAFIRLQPAFATDQFSDFLNAADVEEDLVNRIVGPTVGSERADPRRPQEPRAGLRDRTQLLLPERRRRGTRRVLVRSDRPARDRAAAAGILVRPSRACGRADPDAAGVKVPVRNIYYLLCYAWDHVREGETVDVGSEQFGGLVDLFAKVLNEGVSRLVSRGLDRDYLVVHEDVRGLKGKTRFRDNDQEEPAPERQDALLLRRIEP